MRAADLNACVPGSQRFHVDHSGNIRIRYGPAEKPSGRYADKNSADGKGPCPGQHAFMNCLRGGQVLRSEEHTSELQSLMRISYAVFCLQKKKPIYHDTLRQQLS